MDDGGELPLAQRADGLHLGPLQEAGETELVPAGICDGLVVQLSQTNRTQLVAIRRGGAPSVQRLGSPLTALLVVFPSGRGGCWGWSFRARWHVLRCGGAVVQLNAGAGTVTELAPLRLNVNNIFLAHFNKFYLEISISVIIDFLLRISSNQLPIIEAANKTISDHINTSVERQDSVSPVVHSSSN